MTETAAAQADPPEGYAPLDWRRGFGAEIGPLYRRHGADGQLSLGFRVEERHTNGMGNAHGGMLMTFADMAWGQVVSVEMSAYWVNFIATGDPNGKGLPRWPSFSETDGETMELGDSMEPRPITSREKFEVLKKLLKVSKIEQSEWSIGN